MLPQPANVTAHSGCPETPLSPIDATAARMAAVLAFSLASFAAGASLAQAAPSSVFPVDDSATTVSGDGQPMRWRTDRPSGPDAMTMEGRVTVRLVLDTRPWAGRQARIYMMVEPTVSRLTLQWQGRGAIASGTVESGQRVLFYGGIVPGPSLRDTLLVTYSGDARALPDFQRVRVSYEIEVAP